MINPMMEKLSGALSFLDVLGIFLFHLMVNPVLDITLGIGMNPTILPPAMGKW